MKKFLSLFLIILSCFVVTSCGTKGGDKGGQGTKETLESPSISISEDNLVSWVAVDGASGYVIYVDGEAVANVSTTSYSAKAYEAGSEVKVVAKGDSKTYTNSSFSNTVTVKSSGDSAVYVAVNSAVGATKYSAVSGEFASIYSRSGLNAVEAVLDVQSFLTVLDSFEAPESEEEVFTSMLVLVGMLRNLQIGSDDGVKLLAIATETLNQTAEYKAVINAFTDADYASCGKVIDYLYSFGNSAAAVINIFMGGSTVTAFQAKDAMFINLDIIKPSYEDFETFADLVYGLLVAQTAGSEYFTFVEKIYNSFASILYTSASVVINLFRNFSSDLYSSITKFVGDIETLLRTRYNITAISEPVSFIEYLIMDCKYVSEDEKVEVRDAFWNLLDLIENPQDIERYLVMTYSNAIKQTELYQTIRKYIGKDLVTGEEYVTDVDALINDLLELFGLSQVVSVKDGFTPEDFVEFLLTKISIASLLQIVQSEDLEEELATLFEDYFNFNFDAIAGIDLERNILSVLADIPVKLGDAFCLEEYFSILDAIKSYSTEMIGQVVYETMKFYPFIGDWIHESFEDADINVESLNIEFADVNAFARGIVKTVALYSREGGAVAGQVLAGLESLSTIVKDVCEAVPEYANGLSESASLLVQAFASKEAPFVSYIDQSEDTEELQAFTIAKAKEFITSILNQTILFAQSVKPEDEDYANVCALLSFLGVYTDPTCNVFDEVLEDIESLKEVSDGLVDKYVKASFFMLEATYQTTEAIILIGDELISDSISIVTYVVSQLPEMFQHYMSTKYQSDPDRYFITVSYTEAIAYAYSHQDELKSYIEGIYDQVIDYAIEVLSDNDFSSSFDALAPYYTVLGFDEVLEIIESYSDLSGLLDSLELKGEAAFNAFFNYFMMAISAPMMLLPQE